MGRRKTPRPELHSVPTLDDCYIYPVTLNRVVDGDTVIFSIDLGCDTWLRKVSCRLLGINAPERRGIERQAGEEASDHLEELLSHGCIFVATYKDEEDSFSRLLVDIWCNGINVNDQMVLDGHALYLPEHSY